MNFITNDYGQHVVAIGAPGSQERAKVEWPLLIETLRLILSQAIGSPVQAYDEIRNKIREAGINSPLETDSIIAVCMQP